MKLRIEKRWGGGWLWRLFANNYEGEIAYATFGISGPRAEIEFPSDWHEHRRAWVRLGFILFSVAFSFRWKHVVPDLGQCSGPTYGFYYFSNALVLCHGKDDGRLSAKTFLYMPWTWEHVRHDYLNPDGSLNRHVGRHDYDRPEESKERYPYTYVFKNGKVQERIATINGEEMEWRWRWFRWLPWPRKIIRSINVEFSDEVGERSGSWKGGCTGCSYEWKNGETMEQSLRRMEKERRFT